MTLDKKEYEDNLKQTVKDTKTETQKLKEEFKEVDKSTEQLGKSFERNIGIIALSSFVNLIGVVSQASQKILGFFTDTFDYADKYGDLSAKYDIASQSLQRFEYIASQSGTTLDGVLDVMTMMYNKAKEGGEVFEKLGVSVRDTNGNMKAMDTLFWEVKSALDNVNNSGEKSALMLEVFGRNAMSVGEFLRKDSDELQYLGNQAEELGIIMEESVIDSAGTINDLLDKMRLRGKTAFAELIMGAEDSEEKFDNYMEDLTEIIEAFVPVFTQAGLKLGGALLKGFIKGIGNMILNNIKNALFFIPNKAWDLRDGSEDSLISSPSDNQASNIQDALNKLKGDGYTGSSYIKNNTTQRYEDNSQYNISINFESNNYTEEDARELVDIIVKEIATQKQANGG